ncbi:carbon-nitrogen hydrolase family protein [Thalassotalea ponticola]|uniref:carbon-nitrogen hydrolase family protein n=1 Tax=Thalassotalea ponticola TaxID=1523392 RepID=UPI0025B2CD87|nr:carbon-nitrogen hydrolase family protein [Thalassotalea ponticola]MDN3653504.1 carbon-nitrogen hydrolase family protein [Thalassotalea ponticola]
MPTLTAIQMHSVTDVSANFAFIEAQLEMLTVDDEHLVVLPECCLYFGGNDSQQLALANSSVISDMERELARLAKQYRVYLLAGSVPTRLSDNKFQASSLLFDNRGQRIADYQKLHLFDVDVADNSKHYRESRYTQAGDKTVVQTLQQIQLGLSICYDLRFPALYQQLAQQGANVISVPAAFTQLTGQAHWQPLLQARAIETQCYIVAAGQVGEHQNGRQTHGHSMIIDPWGEISCCLAEQVGSISTKLDMSLLAKVRNNIPVAKHNRFNCSLRTNEPD